MAKILIIDDEEKNCTALVRALRKSYEIFTADSGQSALKILRDQPIDLTLTDEMMPGQRGMNVFEDIKERWPFLPVIMMTGYETVKLATDFLVGGGADFISKPLDIEVLKIKIDRALANAALAERLRNQEENFRKRYYDLFDAANDLIQSVNPDGSFTYANRAWKDTLGYDWEEVRKLFMWDIIHPDSLNHFMDFYKRLISGETVKLLEVNLITKEGGKVVVEGNFHCSFDDAGNPVATHFFFRDITSHKRMEAELLEARSLSFMSRMTASVAHEMRQPLVAADMQMAAIMESTTGEIRESLCSARSYLKGALSVITMLIKVFRTNHSSAIVEVDLNSELKETIKLFAHKMKGINVIFDFSGDVRTRVCGNLSRIFVNLIGNTIDALNSQGELKLITHEKEKYLEVIIEDNGPGISPEVLEKIFEPEFTTKKSGEGAGLGLWIAKQEINRIGGEITVETEVQQFTRFRVLIPRRPTGVCGKSEGVNN